MSQYIFLSLTLLVCVIQPETYAKNQADSADRYSYDSFSDDSTDYDDDFNLNNDSDDDDSTDDSYDTAYYSSDDDSDNDEDRTYDEQDEDDINEMYQKLALFDENVPIDDDSFMNDEYADAAFDIDDDDNNSLYGPNFPATL